MIVVLWTLLTVHVIGSAVADMATPEYTPGCHESCEMCIDGMCVEP